VHREVVGFRFVSGEVDGVRRKRRGGGSEDVGT
jgi:hypothetical protein